MYLFNQETENQFEREKFEGFKPSPWEALVGYPVSYM